MSARDQAFIIGEGSPLAVSQGSNQAFSGLLNVSIGESGHSPMLSVCFAPQSSHWARIGLNGRY
jgi:hypothetical protein